MSELEPMGPEEGVEQFLEAYAPSVRDTTLRKAESRLGFFLEWAEEVELENLNELTGRKLHRFVTWRRQDVAAITLQKQLGTIRQALRWWADVEAVEDGLAERVHDPEVPDGSKSKDVHLDAERAEHMLEYLDRFHRGSRRHALLSLLWRTGMRRSAVRSLDVDDLRPEEHAVVLEHRIDEGTRLKNGQHGERWVYLGPRWYQVLDDYLSVDRRDVTDEHGRRPLFTTRNGRVASGTLYDWVHRSTQPCRYGECPHDRDPEDCEAVGQDPNKCPSSVGPHAVRRGAITHHLNQDVSPDTASERMDVSLEVLYEHYDARSAREKMAVRRDDLEGM